MTKQELYLQNLSDLNRVIVLLGQILLTKELTPQDNEKIKYCTKLNQTVIKKQKYIDALP